MTPLIKTNWQLFSEQMKDAYGHMESWILEDTSLIGRLTEKYGEINLEVHSEKMCSFQDKEISNIEVYGNFRQIYLLGSEKIVFAESFFSEAIIKHFPKFGALGNEALGKYLFSHPNIEKKETYVAAYEYKDKEHAARKCIYSLSGELFSVIEVFLFNE